MSYQEEFWNIRLEKIQKSLEKNNFTASILPTVEAAREHILNELIPASKAKSISFGGSISLSEAGVPQALVGSNSYEVINTVDYTLPPNEMLERRRQALHVDLFLTGTNAITEDGKLVNIDLLGNRIGGLVFGPRSVIVLAGRNKITKDIHAAMRRIKQEAAPINAARLKRKTPCAATGICSDCNSPERICGAWSILEKCVPAGRIHVLLVNQNLGF